MQFPQVPPPCPSGKQVREPQQSALTVQFWPGVWHTSHWPPMQSSPPPEQQSEACTHEPPADVQHTPPVQPPLQQSVLLEHAWLVSTHPWQTPPMQASPPQQSDAE